MNVHISYRLHKTPAVEKEIQHQIEKLQKRLQVFRPELIHLKGMVEEISAREGTSASLNLRLPSGQMAAQTKASTAEAAVKSAFEDLLQQVNKHKQQLRSAHKWTRRGKDASARRNLSVPFEETLAVVFPATVSAEDVRSYVNVNLSRLERFVEREIYFRETADQVAPDSISKEEVIDETIAAALGGDGERPGREKPERLALEPWLYRLALDVRSTNSPAREARTVALFAWKNPPASPTSKPATSPNYNSISRTKRSRRQPSSQTIVWPRPSRSWASGYEMMHLIAVPLCATLLLETIARLSFCTPSKCFGVGRDFSHHRHPRRTAYCTLFLPRAISCANHLSLSVNSRGGSRPRGTA